MLGVEFNEIFPGFEKEEETVNIENTEVALNDLSTIDECKNFIDKINSLT